MFCDLQDKSRLFGLEAEVEDILFYVLPCNDVTKAYSSGFLNSAAATMGLPPKYQALQSGY